MAAEAATPRGNPRIVGYERKRTSLRIYLDGSLASRLCDPMDSKPTIRYAVLRHHGIPDPHFDLMFETSPGSALATWRSTDFPVQATSVLTPLPDHRAEYLAYEGPVSGDRGTVTRVSGGEHQIVQNTKSQLVTRLMPDGQTLSLPRVQT